MPRRATIAAACLAVLLAACGEPSDTRLATMCIESSGDNRVRHAASLASSSRVEVDGERIVIHLRVPVGLTLSGEIEFRDHTLRCVRDEDGVRLVEAVHH